MLTALSCEEDGSPHAASSGTLPETASCPQHPRHTRPGEPEALISLFG